ncbi:atypical/ABC1/ABC1-C protein kinase [Gorgonomyces haynaldii]|nr:atypical/ABC1/ABC1-C protein kinase [Gorgonomyces haynaldii]
MQLILRREWPDSLRSQVVVAYYNPLFPLKLLGRLAYLGYLYLPLMLTFPVVYVADNPHLSNMWIKWAVSRIEHSGPTFTKLGQWASSRTDIFPPFVCNALAKLQSEVKPHSFRYTQLVIERTFGRPMNRIFSAFHPNPIGVGAIAQVYKASLAPEFLDSLAPREAMVPQITQVPNYEDDIVLPTAIELPQPEQLDIPDHQDPRCAVKIIHPNVRELVLTDLLIMESVARSIEVLIPGAHYLSLHDEVVTFGTMMKSQLNMLQEARNLQLFNLNFKNWRNVSFPAPLLAASTPDILIEKFADALPIQAFLKFGPTPFDRKLSTLGLSAFLKMLLLDNHVHTDLHPGNILVTFTKTNDDSQFIDSSVLVKLRQCHTKQDWDREMVKLQDTGYQPHLYFIDAGLISHLEPAMMKNFVDLFQAVTRFDGPLISELMITRSRTPETVVDADGFKLAMSEFIRTVQHNTLAFSKFTVSDILAFVFDQVRTHHVKIEGEFVNIGVGLMLVEGIGRQLEPEMDLLKAAVPFLTQAIERRIEGDVSSNESALMQWLSLEFKNLAYAVAELVRINH